MRLGGFSRLVLALALVATAALGFVQNRRSTGQLLRRADFANVRYLLHDGTAAGMTNSAGAEVITRASSPVEAVTNALAAWSALPGSALRFAPPVPTPTSTVEANTEHIITFADTPVNRAIVGGAVAVTLLCSSPDGTIDDADIIFNPSLVYSTTGAAQTYDIEGVLVHELGHAIGMDHSTVAAASLRAVTATGSNLSASLEVDDRLFAAQVYPSDGSSFGRITGTITGGAGGLRNAVVSALDLERNVIVGAVTAEGGRYVMDRVPPGRYAIAAEPMDGPVIPGHLSSIGVVPVPSFQSAYAGGGIGTRFDVTAGGTVTADIAVTEAAPALNILGSGSAEQGRTVFSFVASRLRPDNTYTVELFGEGLDRAGVGEASILLRGAGLSVVPGSFSSGSVSLTTGETFPTVLVDIEVAADAPAGLASFEIVDGAERALYVGGLSIEPPGGVPEFESAGVVNGASFLNGGIAAGSIATLFGAGVGRAAGAAGTTQPVSGGIVTLLEGTQLLVSGIPAPLFFANAGQINFQVPMEVAGATEATIRVLRDQQMSDSVSIAVRESDPALFVWPGTDRAIALTATAGLVQPDQRAAPGQTIVLFGTGQGPLDNPVDTGLLATGSPLSRAARPVTVRFGSQAAGDVAFAGLAPGFAGLLQINVTIPVDAPSGEAVPLSLEIGGQVSTQIVTLPLD